MKWISDDRPDALQMEGVSMLLKAKYAVLADDMGVGKTWQAIEAAVQLNLPTLVIAPASLTYNWRTEFRTLTDARAYIFNKKTPEAPKDAEVMIVPYSMLKYAGHLFAWSKVVVLDESHFLKSEDSQRTMHVWEGLTTYYQDYVWCLSGTPILNKVPEYWTTFNILALGKEVTNKITTKFPSYYTFCCHFANIIPSKYGLKFKGHKNIPELKSYLEGRYLRRSLDFLKLEEKHISIAVEYRESPDLKQAWEVFLDKGIARDIIAKKETAIAKAVFTADYAETLKESVEGPIIIVSDHRDPVSIISLHLSKRFRVADVNGETPTKQREAYVRQLQSGGLDFLVATIRSIETGFTMTASHHMIFNDQAWVPGTNKQVRGRIKRRTQTKTCIFHYIVGGAMDSHIQKMLTSKEQTLKAVLG